MNKQTKQFHFQFLPQMSNRTHHTASIDRPELRQNNDPSLSMEASSVKVKVPAWECLFQGHTINIFHEKSEIDSRKWWAMMWYS